MAIQFKEHTSLLSTNDKKKCNVTVNVIAQLLMWPEEEKSWCLMDKLRKPDHVFSSIALTATVVLMNEIPGKVDDSWYRGKPYVFIKITATEPSSVMRNAAELKETFMKKYGKVELIPPIIVLYTDGGLEHCRNILPVRIAITVLYHSLNVDMDALGHTYRNPPESKLYPKPGFVRHESNASKTPC